ncbi:hypothetical protein IWZ01DRAFT_541350 [Phyllosticta capitalensis]
MLSPGRISVRGIVAAASIASAPFAFLAGDYNGMKRSKNQAFVDLDILNNQMRQKIPAATDDDLIKARELLWLLREFTELQKQELDKNMAVRSLMNAMLKRLEGMTLMTVAELGLLEAKMSMKANNENTTQSAVALQQGLGLVFLADYAQAEITKALENGAPAPNIDLAPLFLPNIEQARFRWSFGCSALPDGFSRDAKCGLRDHESSWVGFLDIGRQMKHEDLKWVSIYEHAWPLEISVERVD